jgi:YVTN family beta-propeller protein
VVFNKNGIFTFHHYKVLSFFFLIPAVLSCSKDPIREDTTVVPPPVTTTSYQNGIFIVNEGNFNWGNASVTFINAKDSSVQQDVFYANNGRHLGDVAESMQVNGDKGFLIVNNSNKIEVVSLKDFSSVKSITGFSSPRFMAIVDSTKAYVTNMQSSISVLDLATYTVKKTIATGSWTEAIITYENFVFVSSVGNMNEPSAQRNAMILVINSVTDQVVDTIKTGKEPVCMVMDKKDKIWILCTGGFDNYEPASLIRIDPVLRIVDKTYSFPGSTTPSRLCINSTRDTLYFLNSGVYQMPVNSTEIPSQPLIPADGHLFYGLGIDPVNGTVYVSDAVDYVQNGVAYQYDQVSATLLRTFTAGRIPGSFCFTSSAKKK